MGKRARIMRMWTKQDWIIMIINRYNMTDIIMLYNITDNRLDYNDYTIIK